MAEVSEADTVSPYRKATERPTASQKCPNRRLGALMLDRRRVIAGVVIIAGLWLTGTAVAQPLKGRLGHFLLEQTFGERVAADPSSRAEPERWRPWPWADIAPIGELHFPLRGERRLVVDSASGEALAWAAGHVPGTAGLGSSGVTAIAGHRDGRFGLLGDVEEGDPIELTTVDGERIRYVVERLQVVDSTRTLLSSEHTGPDRLVLTTCWPIDALFSGPERLLVQATRVGPA